MNFKRLMIFIVILLSVNMISCSTGFIVLDKIQVIDVFEDNNKNMQLGKNLMFEDYSSMLLKNIPDLKPEDLKYIQWEYFVRSSDNEVSFRIKLNVKNNNLKKNREKISNLFKDSVKKQIDFQLKNAEIFKELITLTESYLKMIDNRKYDQLWETGSEEFLSKMPKEKLLPHLNSKQQFGLLKNRALLCNLPIDGHPDINIYFINFKSEYEKMTVQEFITWGKETGSKEWKIYGYGTRPCDIMCQRM